MKRVIFFLFCSCVSYLLSAQSDAGKQLPGQVIEVTNGRETGVPKVTVSILNYDWDITDENGYFNLPLPTDNDFVKIELDNSPLKIIAPYDGVVNLPAQLPFKILVCGAENSRLRAKVDALTKQVHQLEKEKNLSRRQAAGMHQKLLDTILYYEARIGTLVDSLQSSESSRTELTEAMKIQEARIKALEEEVLVLTQELREALELRFLRQKELHDQISAELLVCLDRLKDLRDRGTPNQLPLFFRSTQMSNDLNNTIGQYNEARSAIVNHYKSQIVGVRQYWDDSDIAAQMEDVFKYYLDDVHQVLVLQMDAEVFYHIRQFHAGQTGRPRAEKQARQAADVLVPQLSVAIRNLELKIQHLLNSMSNNI